MTLTLPVSFLNPRQPASCMVLSKSQEAKISLTRVVKQIKPDFFVPDSRCSIFFIGKFL
jgi:hypothetical protein